MQLKNTPDTFGLVTRLLHWGMAGLILAILALGLRLTGMEPGLANLWLYALHKTLGIALLALVLLRGLWHLASPPPAPLGPPGPAQLAAKVAHWALYALMIAIPLTGWAGSSATGIDVMVADRWTLPNLVSPSVEGEEFWFGLHDILTKLLIGLVSLHILAAFKREMEGDGTLSRMLFGKAGRG